mmetsp:Transcript_20227/g.61606  ORF Transcript_20227/g.61606 Transcript_20227/m.61606 type:complete len:262 (-) Transcript_20227:1506-2291(-)
MSSCSISLKSRATRSCTLPATGGLGGCSGGSTGGRYLLVRLGGYSDARSEVGRPPAIRDTLPRRVEAARRTAHAASAIGGRNVALAPMLVARPCSIISVRAKKSRQAGIGPTRSSGGFAFFAARVPRDTEVQVSSPAAALSRASFSARRRAFSAAFLLLATSASPSVSRNVHARPWIISRGSAFTVGLTVAPRSSTASKISSACFSLMPCTRRQKASCSEGSKRLVMPQSNRTGMGPSSGSEVTSRLPGCGSQLKMPLVNI